ncbi:Arc family DNA-binding protein [Comamonas sp. B21-038]|uniref:Arc family DNA-binding protein n=1 Tax=Comamonas sp. B21-038 TaxID=2918299 RepID=UPI001EFB3098|nr:Arc family DNA-binding protein [Comamonas sp. B21-038]ULR87209.1 Arc family DNA-binding protein [Comamonas sp. B21-038]
MSREDPQMKIRLPAELKARIEAAATASTRTLNAEVVDRLQGSFEAGASPDLIVDQAKQIYDLRRQLAFNLMAMAEAAALIGELKPDEKALIQSLKEEVEKAKPQVALGLTKISDGATDDERAKQLSFMEQFIDSAITSYGRKAKGRVSSKKN